MQKTSAFKSASLKKLHKPKCVAFEAQENTLKVQIRQIHQGLQVNHLVHHFDQTEISLFLFF